MSKKKKQQLAELQAQLGRFKELHATLAKDHAALQASHMEMNAELEALRADVKTARLGELSNKRQLADRENKIQQLTEELSSTKSENDSLATQLQEAKRAAEEAAEAAEAAAATATAAAAAAAAALADDDADASDNDGAGDSGAERMAAMMSTAESTRETHQKEVSGLQKRISELEVEAREQRDQAERASRQLKELEESRGVNKLSQQLRDAEDTAHRHSNELVQQAEKNFKLYEKLEKTKDQLAVAKDELATLRRALVSEVAGPDAEHDLYKHVAFSELIRLALQGKRNGVGSAARGDGGGDEDYAGDGFEGEASKAGKTSPASGSNTLDGIRRAETEVKQMRASLKQAQAELSHQRSLAAKGAAAMEALQQLKDKNLELANRMGREKDRVAAQRDEVKRRDGRIIALSDHVEKLMMHLKHEATAKAKAVDSQRRAEREIGLLKQRSDALVQKNRARERVIRELKEGCRILEDQLRLMDTKYVELRNKLDWTRNQSQREVKRIQAEANKLRIKWMMVAGSDNTLNALGISDEVGSVDGRAKTTAGTGESIRGKKKGKKKARGRGGRSRPNTTGELPPVDSSGRHPLLAFEAPEIVAAESGGGDGDAPWADSKLQALQSSLQST